MGISPEDITILQEIIDLEGNCLLQQRCKACPFRGSCLPEFITHVNKRPTTNQRYQMAFDTLLNNAILGDTEQIRWQKR